MTTQEVRSLQPPDLDRPGEATVRRDGLIVGALVLLALVLRAPNLGRAYWIDEGISVGIASHPLRQLPGLLRMDGSPPLFYVILHFWMRAFGTSPFATHCLALLVSLGAIPLAYWAGRDLFDRRAGVAAAALMATNPFLTWYSTETRMYPIVVVLALAGLTLTVRAVRHRRWPDAAGAVLVFAALLYTHNWGLYLFAATAGVLLTLALARRDTRLALAISGAAIGVLVLWLPWLPSLVTQARDTAAPWAIRPQIGDFFADQASALGGTLGFLVAPLLALGAWWTGRHPGPGEDSEGGVWGIAGHGRQAGDGSDGGPRPATGPYGDPSAADDDRGRWQDPSWDRVLRDRPLARLLGAIGILTALTGWLVAQIEPSWTVRYLAVIVAPLLLAAAGALAPTRSGRLIIAATCVLLAGWSAVGSLIPNPNARYAKSNVAAVAQAASSELAPGDVVVVTQTEQLAVLAHYLPKGLVYITPTGPVQDPYVVDWRNIVTRLRQAKACNAVDPSIEALPVGAHVLEINPVRQLGASGSSWYRAVNAQVTGIDRLLATDPSLQAIASYQQAVKPRPYSPVIGELFLRTAGANPCAPTS